MRPEEEGDSAGGRPEAPAFIHRYVPAASDSPIVLLLLHGTGGNEDDLLGLGRELLPGAAMISPRGKVLENGMPRYFRRLAEGVFDLNDLAERTDELARFVEATVGRRAPGKRVVAVGYSNGANIASSLLLLRPRLLAGAVLLRPMVPFTMQAVPDLSRVSVLIEAGSRDLVVPRDQPGALEETLRRAGARVRLVWQDAGHQLTPPDIATARDWLSELVKDTS
jgi:phospholipase/carboxylesterase